MSRPETTWSAMKTTTPADVSEPIRCARRSRSLRRRCGKARSRAACRGAFARLALRRRRYPRQARRARCGASAAPLMSASPASRMGFAERQQVVVSSSRTRSSRACSFPTRAPHVGLTFYR